MGPLPSTFARRVFDGAHLRALLCARGHRRLMVTFDHWVEGKAGWSVAAPSKAFEENGFDQLRIQSLRNDWFINADTPAFERAINQLARRYDRVHALGYSMGGYGAFRFAGALRLNQILAVSPQYSIHPDVVPFEKGYLTEARGFDPVHGAMRADALPALRAQILADGFNPVDLRHAAMIAGVLPGVSVIRLGAGGHPATGVMQEGGRGFTAHRAAMTEGLDASLVRAAHRACRRASPGYWRRLARMAERSGRMGLMAYARGQMGRDGAR
ncbi:hypothetical protein [Roseicitreum antarcticum]|uniref:hypothetical protein n=1 Tax=Roseicitreum antarcticum TaxID=564137 RepID=UPI000B8566D9|nr:hypothetical protein [Roseicitreum antarcticum]